MVDEKPFTASVLTLLAEIKVKAIGALPGVQQAKQTPCAGW